MTRSLRARLLLGTTLATTVVFFVAAGILYGTLRGALLAEFDNALAARAQALASLVEQNEREIKMDPDPLASNLGKGASQDYFAIWDEHGKSIAQSDWRAGTNGLAAPPTKGSPERASFIRLPGGGRGRRTVLFFTPKREDEETTPPLATFHQACLVLVRETEGLDRRLAQLAWVLTGVFGITMLVSAATMAWVVRRGLTPLNALADRIHAIGATDLSERIALHESPQEMLPVVQRLNELLVNVESAIARERTFTADVTHELRTPLAGLTAALEVCGSRKRQPEEYEQAIGKCLKAARGMHAMVENLLIVARADANRLHPQYEPVNAGWLLQEGWRPFEGRAAARGLAIDWTVADDLLVQTDQSLLRIVVRNLLDNAATYAGSGGRICIEGRQADDRIVLRISNTGSQIHSEQVADVFKRFWRGDAARSDVDQHCGLGLALCRRIVTLLEGTISIDTVLGGTFCVTLHLPAKC